MAKKKARKHGEAQRVLTSTRAPYDATIDSNNNVWSTVLATHAWYLFCVLLLLVLNTTATATGYTPDRQSWISILSHVRKDLQVNKLVSNRPKIQGTTPKHAHPEI